MEENFAPAELKKHFATCKECHDPTGDGGDAYFCPEAETLYLIFRTLLHGSQSVLVH
jgi:hypothetical protein